MASKTSRGGMFGSLRSLVRGTSTRSKISGNTNTNTNTNTTRKSKSTSNLQAPQPNSTIKASNNTAADGASDNNNINNKDSSPSSQSSFFSGRTGEASLSSGPSTPVGPEDLSPAPLSSTHSHTNKPAKKTRAGGGGHVVGNGNRGGGKGEAGAGGDPRGAYRARSRGNHTNAVDRYDDHHDGYVGDDAAAGHDHDHDSGGDGDGDGGDNQPQPPSYESLFLSRRPQQDHEGSPAEGEVADSASAAPAAAPCSRSRGRNGAGKRSSSARFHAERPRRDQQQPQPHILRKQQSERSSGKSNRGSSDNFNRARRAAAATTTTTRSGGGGGNAVAHMSPAERAALRETEEEGGVTDLDQQQQQQQQQQEYMPQYHERRPEGCDDDAGDGPSYEPAAQEAPRRQQVGVPDMEKAYIRSLAETNAEVVADNKRPRPLLADIPRQQLYGAIPTLGGISAKKVAIGHKKTLVLDLDETLVSSSRTPCDCDYKIVFKIHSRERRDADDTFAAIANAPGGSTSSSSSSRSGRGAPAEGSFDGDETIRELHYFVRLRPGLTKFLQKVAAIYELVIWTASGRSYADAIIDLLDPTGELFSARLYRDSCLRYHNLCVKDLRRLGRPMGAVLLLDNYVYSFGLTLDNGVPISPWTGEKEAKASGLSVAYSLLRGVSRFPDVRNPLIMAFDLHRKIHGHPSVAAAASSAMRGRGSTHQRQQRSRFHNPLSPVASCSAMSSASSSSSSSTCSSSSSTCSSESPASTPTAAASPVGFFSGSRVAIHPPSSRGPPVGADPLSPVAAVWAANAAARAEEERIKAQRSSTLRGLNLRSSSTSVRSTSMRSAEEVKAGRHHQKKPKQQQQQGEQEKTAMQAKLAEQVREAKEAKRERQLLQQRQQRQRQQLAVAKQQQLQQAAGVAAATKTVKRGTSGEGGSGLSPVVARWAADAAVRAQKEAEAARAEVALME